MLSFFEARNRVVAGLKPITGNELLPINGALGRVLSEPLIAPFNIPRQDNSAMDGYGARWIDLSVNSETILPVRGEIPAGSYCNTPIAPGTAVRIMTGAAIPPECDIVIAQEDVIRVAEGIRIPPGQKRLLNIRFAGEDMRKGTQVIPQGRCLTPADLGILAALGYSEINVMRRLRVALLSTGNEIIPFGKSLPPGGIYDINRVTLTGALQSLGCEIIDLGIARDSIAEISAALENGARAADALITSGGVSVGDFDLVRTVLAERGTIEFWQVAMKPGKPQAYGYLDNTPFFGLPGNPVSSLVVFQLIVRPALLHLMGALPEIDRHLRLPLRGAIRKKHQRMDFLRAIIHFDPSGSWVESAGGQGSGMLNTLARANAFIVLPAHPVEIPEWDLVDVWEINY